MGKRPTILRRAYTLAKQPDVLAQDASSLPIYDSAPRNS